MASAGMVQWFEEMNLLQSEVNERVATAEKLKSQMITIFSRMRASLLRGSLYASLIIDYYYDDLFDLYMSFSDSDDDDYMQTRAKKWADEIQTATKNMIEGDALEPFLSRYRLGQPVDEEDIPKGAEKALGAERAQNIALHEANVIHNHKRHEELKERQATHTWETMRDERVRLHHQEADGQTVPIDEPFYVGGEYLMFPGDESLGATGKNTILCRCLEI